MSEQISKYGAIDVETPAAATPKRRGLIIALCLCTGGALFAVAGPAKAPRLRGSLPGSFATYWTSMGGVLSQVETNAEGLEVVIATMVNGERVPVCPSGIKDSYGNCVDEGCASWFDGCNTCNVGTDGALGCTRMFCEKPKAAKCLDTPQIVGGPGDDDHDCCGGGSACGWGWCEAQGKCTQVWECEEPDTPDIVGGPTGDAKQDACCGGGSACGWTYCEALDKCVQEWETPCPTVEVGNATTLPASTAPGVVNYFPTVAKQANTDCGGGESVSPDCAGGTTLSTEDKISGAGETVGDVPVSTATTVEGANAGTAATVKCPTECPLMLRRLQACPQPQDGYQYGEAPKDECGCTTGCPPIVKASAATTPIINTAGGVASQSSSNAGGSTVYTGPSGAASRGKTGAGNAKYIPGRK